MLSFSSQFSTAQKQEMNTKAVDLKMPQASTASLSASAINNIIRTSARLPRTGGSEKAALSVLNTFSLGVIHPVSEGSNINHLRNAISLATVLRTCISLFKFTFEAIDSIISTDHTHALVQSLYNLSVTWILLLSPNYTIDS
ncbi:hypothetical protein GX51_06461 [Blastomyces parvus]|uniref:HNH nuclease domain-containing protein n=1 Tax=Blastomyces parvus TaxID=2060905 RepID=A0A2B7WQL3_9EURO|nr:hypothetical protein GX51_06461 [Blastomyces parvus]